MHLFKSIQSLPFRSLRRHSLTALSFSLTLALLLGALPAQPATAQEPLDAQADALKQKIYLPSINRRTPSCATLGQPNIFGVQMYGSTGSQSAYYDAMTGTGADWVRVQIAWSNVEPVKTVPPTYRWSRADIAVGAALDACKRVIVTLVSAPNWAAQYPNSVINSASLDDFANYVGALAERYDGDGIADAPGSPVVNYWEIYNEPDANDAVFKYEGWGAYPEDYAATLKLAHDAIKAHNPKAQVLLGGLAYDDFEEEGGHFVRSFLDGVLEAGGGEYFDIMNFHSFPLFGPRWVKRINPGCVDSNTCLGPGLLEKTEYVRQKLASYQLDKPIMVTESGWHSDLAPDLPSTPEIQARYVTELYVQSKAAGLDATVYFALVQPDAYPYDAGLVTRDVVPKPKESYKAYQTAVTWLADATFIQRLTDKETKAKEMDAYKFLNPKTGRTFYVAWMNPASMGIDLDGDGKPNPEEDTESLRLPGNEVKVYNIYGALVETVTNSDGNIKITIGGQPRYIEITK
jgi:hypothetical protein